MKKFVDNEWNFENHLFKIPIDNNMDMISVYSISILNYYLSKNINLGYKEFDTSALNLMRLESNFLEIDVLDKFILKLILSSDSETIMSDDLQLGEEKKITKEINLQDSTSEDFTNLYNLGLKEARENFERKYFEFHIKSKLSITNLSKKSGVERTHLYRKLKQLKITYK